MSALVLPRNCTIVNLLREIEKITNNTDVAENPKVAIRSDGDTFLHCDALAFLCSWGLEQRQAGRRITAIEQTDALRYLSRMNFFKHLDCHYEETFARHSETGRFIPLQLVSSTEDAVSSSNAICDVVLHQFDGARAFLPALEWAVYEILDNVATHAESPVPGVVCGQYYPKKHILEVAICDAGRGIKATLDAAYPTDSYSAAINKALERGVTRNTDIGQGNGLAGSLEIAKLNGGIMSVRTGDVHFASVRGYASFAKVPVFPGTGISFSLNTQRPVDLGLTFIKDSGWNYINVECERLVKEGGLLVRDECPHTIARESARRLRRKVLALLPDMEGPMVLDFAGVGGVTSSFMDELLGRMAASLGERQFFDSIRIVGASENILRIANSVIRQRLNEIKSD